MAMNSFAVRERGRKRGSNPSTEHNIRLRTDNERLEGSGNERKACLPHISAPNAASQSALHLTLTRTHSHTHKWHHNSISAINLSYEDTSIFSNVNGRVLGVGGGGGQR